MNFTLDVVPYRACPLCLADLSVVQTDRGPTYACRYCFGGGVPFPPKPQAIAGSLVAPLCSHPVGARHIVDDGRTTSVVCSHCDGRHTIGASLIREEALVGMAGRL